MTTDSDIDDIARARPPEMSGPAALRRLADKCLGPIAIRIGLIELAAQWEADRAALEQARTILDSRVFIPSEISTSGRVTYRSWFTSEELDRLRLIFGGER